MADTFSALHVHCVFATKNRQPLAVGEIKERFWVFMSGIATPSCGVKIIPNRRYLGAIQACGL